MRKALGMLTVLSGLCLIPALCPAAESKPLEQLPADVVHWSTLWMEVPMQMYGVEQEAGPLAAMTWGPVRGTVMLVDATAKALWDIAKPDQRNPPDEVGVVLRYEF